MLIAVLSVIGGCSYRPLPAQTADGKVLFRIGFTGSPDSLNPYAAGNDEARAVFSLLYDTLFAVDPESWEVSGSLCSEYEVRDSAAGAKLWRMTLRDDVYWHDGEKLTASDVEFTLQSAKELSTLFSYPDCELLDVTGIAVEDETHLAMVVWGEEDLVKACLSDIPILPRHIWNSFAFMRYDASGVSADPRLARESIGTVRTDRVTMVGSGLYRWAGYENGVCTLERNDLYWGGSARAEVVRLCYNLADTVSALTQGQIDACWEMSLNSYQALAQDETQRLTVGAPGEMYTLGFNFASPSSPIRTPAVRQALEYCTSRDTILLHAFGGGFSERGLLSPFSRYYYMDEYVFGRPYSIETVAGLLTGAGYSDKNGDGILEGASGEPLSLTLLYSSADSAWEQAAGILKAGCARAGIEIRLLPLPPGEFTSAVAAGLYDLVLTARKSIIEPAFVLGAYYWNDGDNAFAVYDRKGVVSSLGWNDSGYSSAGYDAIYERLLRAADDGEKDALTAQAGEYLYNDTACVTIGFAAEYQACSRIWGSVRTDPETGLYFTPRTLCAQLRSMTAGGR